MSVALVDQGEMVPGRGTTRMSRPESAADSGPWLDAQQLVEPRGVLVRERAVQLREMDEIRAEPNRLPQGLGEPALELAQAEIGERGVAAEYEHGGLPGD